MEKIRNNCEILSVIHSDLRFFPIAIFSMFCQKDNRGAE